MNKRINTVAKGDAFENRVYAKLKELLESDMLGVSGNHSKIFQKRSYKGLSGNEPIFDIAIETYHAGSDECVYLTLIECKDYKSTIPVEKVRAFASSVNDVGANKGFFISTSQFQKGAINHAQSYKIGLARFASADLELNWLFRRVGHKPYQERRVAIEQLYTDVLSENRRFNAVYNYYHYSNFIDFISEQLFDIENKINVPYISDEEIKLIMLKTLSPLGYTPDSSVTSDYLEKIVTDILGAKIISTPEKETNDLGYCDFKNKVIYIRPQLAYDTARWRFTLAHEIGHYILHEKICITQYYDRISDKEDGIEYSLTDKTVKRLEIQANRFAAFLIIPEYQFRLLYIEIHRKLGISKFPYLYLDNHLHNIKTCTQVFSYISERLNISIEAVKIKLISLNLLKIQQSTQSSRDILRGLY
ncbi:MAG: ImmA/IrrE family metallo-endopeptidase [Rikenellaceae bacterium]